MRTIVWTALLAFGLSSAGVISVASWYVDRFEAPAIAGRRPVSVLVAAHALPAHSKPGESDLRVETIETQLVTEWAVPAGERSSIIGQEPKLPLRAGDPLRWTHFGRTTGKIAACVTRLAAVGRDEATAAAAGVLARYPPLPVAQPQSAAAGTGMVDVVVARGDLPEGTVLDEKNLSGRALPAELVTESVVRLEDRRHLFGTRLSAALFSGDPILFQFVREPEPRMAWDCVAEATDAARTTRLAAERAAASAYFGEGGGAP